MRTEDIVNEFVKRQVYYDSSCIAKLNAVNGKWFYKIYAWVKQDSVDSKILVTEGKYNGENPLDLIQVALLELGCRKIKLGVPQ